MTEVNTINKTKPWQLGSKERKFLLVSGDLLMSILALVLSLYWWDQSMPFIDLNLDYMQKRGFTWFYALPLIWMVFLFDIKYPSWQETGI